MLMLQRSGEFRPVRIAAGPPERALRECIAAQPEILLMDVTPTSPATDLAGRMQLIEGMRREQPGCKIAILFMADIANRFLYTGCRTADMIAEW